MKPPYPAHGTRARNRAFGCTCIACSRRIGAVDDSYELRWPYAPLQREIGAERMEMWFDYDQITDWRKDGLTDAEADMVAIRFGILPHEIWGGYLEAGLDYKDVNRASVD